MQVQAMGMAWFDEEDYASFRRVLPGRAWHATWVQWRDAAEQNIERLQRQGVVAIKAHVKSDEFVAWCRDRGVSVDTQALTAFAAEFAQRSLAKDEAQ